MKPSLYLRSLGLLTLLLVFSGCVMYRSPVKPPPGGIYSHYKVPVTTNFKGTPAKGKVGRAATSLLVIPFFGRWDFAWDDASIEAAAKNGGITKVYYAEHEFTQVLGIWGEYRTTVYGE